MAQPQPSNHTAQQRPPFSQSTYTPIPRDFQPPGGRSNSFGAASPTTMPSYSSPSPQQFLPNVAQIPPSKRPRLSPDAPSPFSTPTFSPVGTPPIASPVNGTPPINTINQAPSRPNLMLPPQRPVEKEDRSYDDILSGTGIVLEEEQRNLTRNEYYSLPSIANSTQMAPNSFESNQTDSSSGGRNEGPSQSTSLTAEQILQRENTRADWEAARHAQNPLWDMFLFGGTLNDKIKKISTDEHMTDPQTGVLVNTQKNAPPPAVRVNGMEGASRVIDKGQSILDTRDKAERLSDIMKLVSLATKSRLTGLLNASARLSFERREHSKGRVPDEWAAMASTPPIDKEGSESGAARGNGTPHKRTLSQANSEAVSTSLAAEQPHPAVMEFEKSILRSQTAEEARLAKRAKRLAASKAEDNRDGDNSSSVDMLMAAANANADAEKKTTKKERKIADAKFNEQQQHKSANEAARMATSGLIGRGFGGKKSKSYAWMTGGGGGGAGGAAGGGGSGSIGSSGGTGGLSTSNRPSASMTGTPVPGTPATSRAPTGPRGRRFVQWDEDKDPGIQSRDILSVLDSDGKAARSYVRGCSLIDS